MSMVTMRSVMVLVEVLMRRSSSSGSASWEMRDLGSMTSVSTSVVASGSVDRGQTAAVGLLVRSWTVDASHRSPTQPSSSRTSSSASNVRVDA